MVAGDVSLIFSTAKTFPHDEEKILEEMNILHDSRIDLFFEAGVEAVEEAVLNAMVNAVEFRFSQS